MKPAEMFVTHVSLELLSTLPLIFVNAKLVSIKMQLSVMLVLTNVDHAQLQLFAQLALTMPPELSVPTVSVMLELMMLEQLSAQLAHLSVLPAHQPLPVLPAMLLLTELLSMDNVFVQLDSSRLSMLMEASLVLLAHPAAMLAP